MGSELKWSQRLATELMYPVARAHFRGSIPGWVYAPVGWMVVWFVRGVQWVVSLVGVEG